MFYSKSTGGFYSADIHGDAIPFDAVEITVEQHAQLMADQSAGATIQADANGYPVAVFPPPPSLDQIKADLCARIDREADAARLKIAGDPLRVVEYQQAETEAAAYKAAGYTGTVPPSVQSWAEAKGWTAQQAADDILTVAAGWRQALYVLRDIRLKGKEAIRAGADEAAANAAADAASGQIKAVLSAVGV